KQPGAWLGYTSESADALANSHSRGPPFAISFHNQRCAMAYIVIVDDSPVNALPLGRLLKYSGHEVECLLRSGGAVENLREHKPDLVLLDVGMPDIDGIELLEKIRSEEHTSEL